MYTVGVLPLEGFALMSYASVVEPLRAANLLSGEPIYNIKNITISKFGVESSSGALIRSDNLIGEAGKLDLLFVIAGGDPFLVSDKRLFNWLKRLAKFGTIVGGVSGGPVILVKAGLMKDRRMTVHWELA